MRAFRSYIFAARIACDSGSTCSFCNSTSLVLHALLSDFPGRLLSDEILLAIGKWEVVGMAVTSGNGKGMKIKLD